MACGPVQYIGQVSGRTSAALRAAHLAEADRFAPYEYTKAAAYYDKAREEAAGSSFELAVDYGRRSQEFAQRAQALARQRAERRARQREAPPAESRQGNQDQDDRNNQDSQDIQAPSLPPRGP
jgi:hypothetical protein